MSAATLTAPEFRRALLNMADDIIRAESRLNDLDSALGDGDHGVTMRLGFEAVKARVASLDAEAPMNKMLLESAQAFMGVTGGAICVIMTKMLMGGAKAIAGADAVDTTKLHAMLAGMNEAVATAGKVKPGDKTILDGIHAATEAAEAAVKGQQPLGDALSAVAAAAEAGAQRTAEMVCRVGRGSRLGERTLGHLDPGAVSFSILLRSLSESHGG